MKEKSILESAAIIVVLFMGLSVLLMGCEEKLIYYPYKYPEGQWNTGQVSVEDIWFNAEDGVKLHGWFIPVPKPKATLIWFHGNAGNISYRLDNIAKLQPLGLNIFIFDYRGYGRSEGTPKEKGLMLDSQAAYDYVIKKRNIKPEQVILFGRSLGGFFASVVAEGNPAAGLIIESTFTSAEDMAKEMFSFPVGFVIRSKLDTINYVSKIKTPKLFLHGTSDETIPYSLGKKLFDASANPKEFYDIEGADHNNTYVIGGQGYFEKIDSFIEKVVKAKEGNHVQ